MVRGTVEFGEVEVGGEGLGKYSPKNPVFQRKTAAEGRLVRVRNLQPKKDVR